MSGQPESIVQPEVPSVRPPLPSRTSGKRRNATILVALISAVATIVAAYIGVGSSHKEKINLTGHLYSRKNSGIEGATLSLAFPGRGVITTQSREQGYFIFPDLPELEGILTITADGYHEKPLDITPLQLHREMQIELIATDSPPPPKNKPDPSVARAEANQGWWFETGQIGAGPDYDAAMKSYLKAVEDGDVIANWNIARLYEHGLGVPKDLEKAKDWYQKAADQGDARSQAALNHLGQNP